MYKSLMQEFTHIDDENQPGMVDIFDKSPSQREAVAECIIHLGESLMQQLSENDIQSKKGPVFQTAIIAGTMAAKNTSSLIPFCHPIPLEKCKFKIEAINSTSVSVKCTCLTTARTGVEMEALTGASIASLTIYDMCKAVNKGIVITSARLLSKTGGKSDFNAQ